MKNPNYCGMEVAKMLGIDPTNLLRLDLHIEPNQFPTITIETMIRDGKVVKGTEIQKFEITKIED